MYQKMLTCLTRYLLVFAIVPMAFADDVFELPTRLTSDGQVIDTGAAWGHSSPCVEDLDGDGLADLLLGDFGGKFHIYRNVGTAENPDFKAEGLLQAGGVDAEVRIYCCIGSQARFCDLNGDGFRDLVSNSYDPGHCYVFRGLADHRFASREVLKDKNDVPLRSAPVQKQDHQSFGSFFTPVDWDDDGDFDMLVGCFDGTLKLRINEGTAQEHSFASENVSIEIDGGPLKVKAHLCPVTADWDGDGLWDLIAGSDDGSVTWFRNVGSQSSPRFASGETLVKKNGGVGYNLVFWNDETIVPGIRSQIEVVDFNNDGKLDLLLGDFYTAFDLVGNLSDEQKSQVTKLTSSSNKAGEAFGKKMEALREDFIKRYPDDAIFSEEANEEWMQAYQELKESPEAKKMDEMEAEFAKKMRPFLADTRGEGDRVFDLAKSHGHVWLYLRK